MNYKDFYWIRQPKSFELKDDILKIETNPHTDLWQRTYYHFRNDNAPMFVMDTEQEFFSFVVKTHFSETNHRFDQCGIIVYLDSENWLKCSVEYENEIFQHLGSVVTNNGFSDWATTTIPANVKCMWYRLSRRGDDFCFENSFDGINFSQMRICHLSPKKLGLVFMRALQKTPPLRLFSVICKLHLASGKHIMVSNLTKHIKL